MSYNIYRNNIFSYGEVGERLSGIRESEIYSQSAKKIENLVINEIGNLKLAKKWSEHNLIGMNKLVKILDTKYNFYIGIAENNIYTITKDFSRVLHSHSISGKFRNYKLIENRLFLVGDRTKTIEFNKSTGAIGISNFMDLLKFPVKNKEDVKIDLYKVYYVNDEYRVSLLGTYTNPKLRSDRNGIYLANTNIKIERLYKQYKASVEKEDINSIYSGLVFGVFHNFQNADTDNKYLIGNTEVSFSSERNDVAYRSTYYERMTEVEKAAEICFGEILRINENITDVGMFEDRMYIVRDGMFFFSKKGDYFDFLNSPRLDGAFFFRPTPINNIFPEIYSTEAGNRIYATTSGGVYVISSINIFSSSSYRVYVASEIPCKDKGVLIEDNFFYLSKENSLKCVQLLPNQANYEAFSTVSVEKYDIYFECESITKLKYDNKIYLVGTKKRKGEEQDSYNSLFFYQALDYNLFRKFTINSEHKFKELISVDKYIQTKENVFLTESINNMQKAILSLNAPYIKTSKGGNYSNDYASTVERVFIKVLNEDKEAIKGIKIYDTSIKKVSSEDDLFSVFKLETSQKILNGYTIEIVSNENNKIFEILGIDTKIKIASD